MFCFVGVFVCLFFVCFYVVLPFQHYSTLFVILECFCPQKYRFVFFFFLCNISSLCAISYVPMVAIYVYQLNIWLLFESIWLNSMFISHEGIVCLYLHTKLHPGGKYSKPRSWQPVESSSSRTYFNLKSNIVPASMPLSRKRVNLANGLFQGRL